MELSMGDKMARLVACGVEEALHLKDGLGVSDSHYYQVGSSTSSKKVFEIIQLPRANDVIAHRKLVSAKANELFGLKMVEDLNGTRCVASVSLVIIMMLFEFVLRTGLPLSEETVYLFKLSFDGTLAGGGKSLLAFFLVPLSLGLLVQSNSSCFPIGLGWSTESMEKLTNFFPGLAEAIKTLNSAGLSIVGPGGRVFLIKIRVELGSDLSAIWKLMGIGSASNTHSCPYCMISKTQRQHFGSPFADLKNHENVRCVAFTLPFCRTLVCHASLQVVQCICMHRLHVSFVRASLCLSNFGEARQVGRGIGDGTDDCLSHGGSCRGICPGSCG
jgi:hypothetical protein